MKNQLGEAQRSQSLSEYDQGNLPLFCRPWREFLGGYVLWRSKSEYELQIFMERRGEETAACVRAVLVGHHTALALLVFLLLQCYGHLFDPSICQTPVLSGCLRACGQSCGKKMRMQILTSIGSHSYPSLAVQVRSRP
jgi:hypothetical protein